MQKNKLVIWDEVYPCEFFAADIQAQRLFLLLENSEILSAFALCCFNEGESCIGWQDSSAKALYLDRLGVNTAYARNGIGGLMLAKAQQTARALGAEYLRLFVVDSNLPAMRLYSKSGFTRADGIYRQKIDDACVLQEFGYEIKL